MKSVTLKSKVYQINHCRIICTFLCKRTLEIWKSDKKVTDKLKTSPLIPSSATDLILLITG